MKKLFDGLMLVLPVLSGGSDPYRGFSLAKENIRTVRHAFRSALVLSAAMLLLLGYSPAVPAAEPDQCSEAAAIIAAGGFHTAGLNKDGTVGAVGDNSYKQLEVSSWTNIKAVAAGWYNTAGLKGDGRVVVAGANGSGQRNVSAWSNIKAIAMGAYHTVGLKGDGRVVAAGSNVHGQRNVSSWSNIKAIAAGVYHTVGLRGDGRVVAVGSSSRGQLNVSTWRNIKAIAAGVYHTVGLKEDGTVVAVGKNKTGQLNVSSWTNIGAITAGVDHTVGLKEDGTVAAAGDNEYGQAYTTPLSANCMPICGVVREPNADATAPVTTARVNEGTLGNNQWYVTTVQMILTATDNAGGSGVEAIHYSVNGNEITSKGNSATVTIVDDGAYVVTWYAIDNAGNAEAPQQMNINIDKTPPAAPSPSASPSVLWPPNHKMMAVVIRGSASDSGSGVASTVITVTDEYGTYNSTVPGFGDAIALESWCEGADKDGRVYTITAVTADYAGNQSTGTTTVIVPHDQRK